MHIVFDLQGAQEHFERGIGRWSCSLITEIISQRNDDCVVVLNTELTESYERYRSLFEPMADRVEILHYTPVLATNDAGEMAAAKAMSVEVLRALLNTVKPAVVFCTHAFPSASLPVVRSPIDDRWKTVVLFYDLIPYLFPDRYLNDSGVRAEYEKGLEFLRQSDQILCISASAAGDLVKCLKIDAGKVHNASCAASETFSTGGLNGEQSRLEGDPSEDWGIQRPFVFCTGGDDWRKNLEGLIRAFALIPAEVRGRYQLVVTCALRESTRTKLEELAKQVGLGEAELVLTGKVSDAALRWLYGSCSLFVFPSFYEGFGLPVLEAMNCGAPVLASNNSSLPEIVGWDDAMFDPDDLESMSALMTRALADEGLRAQLTDLSKSQSRKFSVQQCATLAAKAVEQLLEGGSTASGAPEVKSADSVRPLLAMLTPVVPEASGVATYVNGMLPALSKFYRIELIALVSDATDPWVIENLKLRSVDWFKKHYATYDRVVYQVGNSMFHWHMFDLMKVYPGVVVMHDFYISGVLNHVESKISTTAVFGRALLESHGWKAVTTQKERMHSDVAERFPCNRGILQNALGVILHSNHTADLARQFYQSAFDHKLFVSALAKRVSRPPATDRKEELRRRYGYPQDVVLVAAFGMIAATKLPDLLLEAWPRVRRLAPQAKLLLVGEWCMGYDLEQRVRKNDSILITGRVTDQEYEDHLQMVDLAVQLRKNSRGESSGALLDVMSQGLPVVINAHGSMAEIPEDVVAKLEDQVDATTLADKITDLINNPELAGRLGQRAREYVELRHDPDKTASRYCEIIESIYTCLRPQFLNDAAESIRKMRQTWPDSKVVAPRLASAATSLTRNHLGLSDEQRILFDVTRATEEKTPSGLQRVIRHLSNELDANAWAKRVERVKISRHHRLNLALQSVQEDWKRGAWQDEYVHLSPTDIYLNLDVQPGKSPLSLWRNSLRHGGGSYFCVHDLTPFRHPQFFNCIRGWLARAYA